MKIHKFQGRGVNGHLDINLDFHNDCSFLTGINGSGKTTVLNLISSLITPNWELLSWYKFEQLKLKIQNSGNNFTLVATKSEEEIKIFCSNLKNSILTLKTFNGYINKHFIHQTEVSNKRQEFFQHFEMVNKNNEVLKQIYSLPTPIFLTKDQILETNRKKRIESQPQNSSIDEFDFNQEQQSKSALEINLAEIEKFITNSIMQSYFKKSKLDSEFNNTLVNELLKISPIELGKFQLEKSNLSTKKLNRIKNEINNLTNLVAIPSELSKRLMSFVEYLENKLNLIEKSHGQEEDVTKLELSLNQLYIDKITALSEFANEYAVNKNIIFQEIDKFLDLVNRFFSENGKILKYNEKGQLFYTIEDDDNTENMLNTLSLGEVWLVIMLANNIFKPKFSDIPVVILIDEPELSLHVRWQGKLIDALIEASNDVQYIIATHSPEIIMG